MSLQSADHISSPPPIQEESISPETQRRRTLLHSPRTQRKALAQVVEKAVSEHFQDFTGMMTRLYRAHQDCPSLTLLPRIYEARNVDDLKIRLTGVFKRGEQTLLFEVLRDPEEVIRERIAAPIKRKGIDLVRAAPAQIAGWLRYFIGEKDPNTSFFTFNGQPAFHPILNSEEQDIYIETLCTWLIRSLTPLLPQERQSSPLSIEEQGALLAKDAVSDQEDADAFAPLKETLKEKLSAEGRPKPKTVQAFIERELPAFGGFNIAQHLDWERKRNHDSLADDLTGNVGALASVIQCEERIPCFHVLRAFYGFMGATFALKDTYPKIEEIAIFKQKKGTPTHYRFEMKENAFFVEHKKEYVLTGHDGEILAEMELYWELKGYYDPHSTFEGTLRCENFHFSTDDVKLRRKIHQLLFFP